MLGKEAALTFWSIWQRCSASFRKISAPNPLAMNDLMELLSGVLLLCIVTASSSSCHAKSSAASVVSDGVVGGGVSLLQASKRLWMPTAEPAPPAESSLEDLLPPKVSKVNLSNAMNYSVIENVSENLTEENLTHTHVPMVKTIKGATPMPVNASALSHLVDCVMSEWSDWSDCVITPATGLKGAHQVRRRDIIQPWLPHGEPCLPQLEGRECRRKMLPI